MITKKSMTINGFYLESMIDGYTTLDVSGRESLSSSLDVVSVNNRHGSIYKSKTYGPRTLSISFAIEAETQEDALDKVEALNGYLDYENVTVYFNDEADRIYNVDAFTDPSISIMVAPGSGNAVVSGSFNAYCSDPFKYSRDEYEVEPEIDDDGYPVFFVDYDGTFRSYPIFETQFYSRSQVDKLEDVKNDMDEIYEGVKKTAYQWVDISSGDFVIGEYYTIQAQRIDSFIDEPIYILDIDYEDAPEELPDDDPSIEIVSKKYILEDELTAEDFDPEDEYYIINATPVSEFSAGEEYYILTAEAIDSEDAFDMSSDEAPEEDVISGDVDDDLDVTGACGYVAFVDDDSHILQFGDPSIETPQALESQTQKLFENQFTKQSNYSQSVQSAWSAGVNPPTIYWPVSIDEKAFNSDKANYYLMTKNNSGYAVYTSQSGKTFDKTKTYYRKQTRTIDGSFSEDLRENAKYGSISNDQTILKWTTSAKGMKYKIWVDTVTERTSTSCKITFKISGKRTGATIWKKGKKYKKKVGKKTKEFKHAGTQIVAKILIGGSEYNITLLKASETWTKGKTKTKTKTVTLSGLSTQTQSYSGMKFTIASAGEVNVNRSSTNLKAISLPRYIPMESTKYYLKPSYISAIGWHGPAISRNIPNDSQGGIGAGAFTLTVKGKFCVGNQANYNLQKGVIGVYVLDSSNRLIAGTEVIKTSNSGTNAFIRRFLNGGQYGSKSPDDIFVQYKNTSNFTLSIARNAEGFVTYTFETNLKKKRKNKKGKYVKNKKGDYIYDDVKAEPVTTTVASDVNEYVARKIVIATYSNGAEPAMSWCGFTNISFVKDAITLNEDPYVFHHSDQLLVDCSTGDISLNGVRKQNLGALGNDWETLYLDEGLNQIKALYSDFAKDDTAYRQCLHTDSYSDSETYYTKSNDEYVEVSITEEQYEENTNQYYILESTQPKFLMRYREVFI